MRDQEADNVTARWADVSAAAGSAAERLLEAGRQIGKSLAAATPPENRAGRRAAARAARKRDPQ